MIANLGPLRTAGLLGASVFLTAITGILGGAPLKAFRLSLCALTYWLICLGTVALILVLGFYPLAVAFFLLAVLIGTQTELQLRGLKNRDSSFYAVLTTSVGAAAGAYLWLRRVGASWKPILDDLIKAQLSKVAAPEFAGILKIEELAYQVPSIIIVTIMVVMAITLIMEKSFFNVALVMAPKKESLRAFSLPEGMIWTLIVGLLFGFWKGAPLWQSAVGMNLLNVAIAAYFFQGLAVVCFGLTAFRVGAFWRALILAVLILQLFLLVSLLGIIDYWADFRGQIAKKTTALKRKRISD